MNPEPVVLVRTALDAGALLPLGEQLAAAGLHPFDCPRPALGSIRGESDSVAEQIGELAHAPVHVLGSSYSAAVALRLTADHPDLVRTLTLVEPPPAGTAHDDAFHALCRQLIADHRDRGTAAALEQIMTMLAGVGWRERQESLRPGSVADIEAGAEEFFTCDLRALLAWTFSDEEALRLECPTLVLHGSETSPQFVAMARRLDGVVPTARLAVVPGADHLAASTHPAEVAALVVDLLRRTA